MEQDIDLLRALLIGLESAERSPPEPIVIDMRELAAQSRGTLQEILHHLEFLARAGFIDGPGVYREEAFLFRRLTRKGRFLVGAIRDPEDWRKVKAHYLSDSE